MNTSYLSLSSNATSYNKTFNFLALDDVTTLNVNLTGVSETFLPCFLEVAWGDGTSDFFENDIVWNKFSPINRYSLIFSDRYEHVYYPSSNSKSQTLTATFTVKYCNNNISTFTVPISVVNDNYADTIDDIKLINTISKSDKKIHQFVTKNGGYLIELETPFN